MQRIIVQFLRPISFSVRCISQDLFLIFRRGLFPVRGGDEGFVRNGPRETGGGHPRLQHNEVQPNGLSEEVR